MQHYERTVDRWSIKAAALVGGVGLLLLAGIGSAGADVVSSKHDMVNNANAAITTTGTTQTCKFCHFPHNFNPADGPLWNRNASVATAWTPYSSTTLDATVGAPTGVSLACLSCHDGATALDSLAQLGGETIVTTVNAVAGGSISDLASTNANVGGLSAPGTGDLSNDHPVSMVVDAGDAGIDTPANIILGGLTLYGAGANEVQCASCHDPHQTANAPFLRKANANSAICTTCHLK